MDYPNRVIKLGEKDPEIVRAVKEALNNAGCGPLDTANSNFGPTTTQAVKMFQSTRTDKNGNPLEIDGKLGSIGWEALFGPSTIVVTEETENALLAEVLNVARSQIGTMENPLGSNSGPEVDQYLASVGLPPGLFWCMSFVYWTFNEASKNLGRTNPAVKTGGCIDHWNRTKAIKITTDEAVDNPSLVKPGQIFIINHGGGAGHTGIVESVEGGFINTIEGNSNPEGNRNGIGVFQLQRKIGKISMGFIEYN